MRKVRKRDVIILFLDQWPRRPIWLSNHCNAVSVWTHFRWISCTTLTHPYPCWCVCMCVSHIYMFVCVCVCVVVNSVRFLGGPLPSECLALTIDWFLGNQKEWRVPTQYQMRTDCLCTCTLLLDFCLCPLLCKITRKPLQMINPSHITGGCFYFSSRQQLQCFYVRGLWEVVVTWSREVTPLVVKHQWVSESLSAR